MMRCPDCSKFVSYDEPECDLESVDIVAGVVQSSVTVNLNCQECGTTLKSSVIEGSSPIEHNCSKDDEDGFDIENDGEPEGQSRVDMKCKNGRPVGSSRYAKTYYGFTLDSEVICNQCGESFTVTTTGEAAASEFEEVV